MSALGRAFSSRRGRLMAVLVVASVAVTVLAAQAAGDSLSYYVTPEEFAQQLDAAGKRWRVGGRVVDGSIVEERGRAVRFDIEGEHGEHMTVDYPEGPLPGLFGPRTFVVVEGASSGPGVLAGSSVIVKHEDEFLAATPAAGR